MLALHLLQSALVHITPCCCKPRWRYRSFTTASASTNAAP